VDPDNRRPVDFEKRRAMPTGIREQDDADIGRLVQDLLAARKDGKIKLFLIYRALKAKKTRVSHWLPVRNACP
jgi:(1->4)-alpha-D-glucan 1-alpha-D-glucosylmutase